MAAAPQPATKVLVRRDGPIAHIVLNRPEKLNAIDGECLDLLDQAIVDIGEDSSARVVVVSGAGRCFSAGADLSIVEQATADPAPFAAFLQHWNAVLDRLESCPRPTIGAVHGFALAGGFELTLVCDLVVIGASATLADQHARFGLVTGGSSTYRLPRLVPSRAAMRLLLTGDAVDARTALALGLVNDVVADDDVLHEAMRLARTLAERSATASAAIKRAVLRARELPRGELRRLEQAAALDHVTSADSLAGLAAFRARVTPTFGLPAD